jgi:hypothetical protein
MPTDLEAMKAIDNVSKALKKFSIEEFEAANGIVREINGQIVLGKTEDELLNEKSQVRITEIDRQLSEINVKQSRSSAEIADALANGRMPDSESVTFHSQREKRAAQLRRERAELLAS